MPLDDYLAGLAFFAGTVGGVLVAAALVVRRRLPGVRGAPRAVAFGLIATAGVVAAHLLPGLLGVLSRWTALASALALLALSSRLPRTAAEADAEEARPPHGGAVAWLAAGAGAGALALWTVANAWSVSGAPSTGVDTLTHHLPNIARWIQSGSFWQVDQFTPLLANGNYPQNGDVVFLAAVLPWENDAFVRLVNLPFVALTALAVYALALELRAPRPLAVLSAAVLVSLPVVTINAYSGAMTDLVMLAAFGAGLLFLVRHARTGARADLVLGGLGLGVAFGTKWYGVSSVVAVLAIWIAVSLVRRRPPREVALGAAALASLVALTGGFWLVRNWVESGNPVFPVEVAALGATLFDAPRDVIRECAGFTIAHYLDAPGAWDRYILPAYEANYALPGLFLLGALAAAPALALRRLRSPGQAGRRRRAARAALVLSATAVVLAAVYAVTPYSAFGPEGRPLLTGANARYLLPALLAAAGAAAWTVARAGRLAVALEALALVAVADGIRRGFTIPRADVAVAGLALLGLGGGGALAWWLSGRLPGRARTASRAALVALAAAALAATGHARQRAFNDDRYAATEPPVSWLQAHAREGHRVGLAGVWGAEGMSPVLPAFGPRLGNDVRFVGELVDGQLREYASRERWLDAIARDGYDLLLVGRGGYGGACHIPGSETDDDRWAREARFPVIAGNRRLTLYRVPAALGASHGSASSSR